MFGLFGVNKKKTGEIDAQLHIVANSLANNYKDAARDGLKEAKRLFEAMEGELPERDPETAAQLDVQLPTTTISAGRRCARL